MPKRRFTSFFPIIMVFSLQCARSIEIDRSFPLDNYPNSGSFAFNPALLTMDKGQTITIKNYAALSNSGGEYISIGTHLFSNVYAGISTIQGGSRLSEGAPDFIENNYGFSVAFRHNFSGPWFKSFSIGNTQLFVQTNAFDLEKFMEYSSMNAVDLLLFDDGKWKIRTGISSKRKNTYVDQHLYLSGLKGLFYLSYTLNLRGEKPDFDSGVLFRLGALTRSATYSLHTPFFTDIALKFRPDDSYWLGLDFTIPINTWWEKGQDMHIVFDYSHKTWQGWDERLSSSYILGIKFGFHLF